MSPSVEDGSKRNAPDTEREHVLLRKTHGPFKEQREGQYDTKPVK